MKPLALIAACAALALSVCVCPTQAQDDEETPKTQTITAYGQALSIEVPASWFLIRDDLDSCQVGATPDGSIMRTEAPSIRVVRIVPPEGESAADGVEQFRAAYTSRGHELEPCELAEGFTGYRVTERQGFYESRAGVERRGVVNRTTFASASDTELLVLICTFTEPEDGEALLTAEGLEAIATSIRLLDIEPGPRPIPDVAVVIDAVPFEQAYNLQGGDSVTLVLPDGQSLAFWALMRDNIGGPDAASGLDISWGERPFSRVARIEESHEDGRVTSRRDSYIEQGSVITRGSREKVRELYVVRLEILLTQDMEAEAGMPVVVTIREREEVEGDRE